MSSCEQSTTKVCSDCQIEKLLEAYIVELKASYVRPTERDNALT